MKRKHRLLALVAMAALLAAGAFWFTRPGRGPDLSASSPSLTEPSPVLEGQPGPDQTNNPRPRLAPPDPTRRFREFTPEQRVQQARKGHGPGG